LNGDLLNEQAAQALLRSYGIQGTDAELSNLIRICDYRPQVLDRVGVILRNLADSQVSRLNQPDVLERVIHALLHSDYPSLALGFYRGGYSDKSGYVEYGSKKQ